MHTKTDSDVTSPAPSSPIPPAYFVQSPSHDGEKTTSLHSTPVVLSPLASPPNYQSSHHSRQSSSTRFSGSRNITRNDVASKKQNHTDVIKEDGVYDIDLKRGVPRRCHVLGFVVGFFVLFLLFWLVLWGVSKPQKPVILVKVSFFLFFFCSRWCLFQLFLVILFAELWKRDLQSIKFENFLVQSGADFSGVPTYMVSMNSTVKLTFRNTATFFGVHVASTPLDLYYSYIPIGSGAVSSPYLIILAIIGTLV